MHECTFIDSTKEAARSVGHSTAGMAGAFASDVRAKALVLTHFSNAEVGRYVQPSSSRGLALWLCCGVRGKEGA